MRTTLAGVLLGLSATAAIVTGCAARSGPSATPPASEHQVMKIELLGFPGCPNTPSMRANLAAALASIGPGLTFIDTNQEALPESDVRRGWPTPTILVNGRDLFDMAPPIAPSMGCRMYPGDVPAGNEIACRLRALGRSD